MARVNTGYARAFNERHDRVGHLFQNRYKSIVVDEEAYLLALARCVCAELPDVATIARPLAARGRKVYVDYLQNGRGKLIAAPLSVRPRPGAPVSMPLSWRQVTKRLDPARWTIETALARLREQGDPFLGVLGESVNLPGLLEGLSRRLGPGN